MEKPWDINQILANKWWVDRGNPPLLPHQARYVGTVMQAERDLAAFVTGKGAGATYARDAATQLIAEFEALSTLLDPYQEALLLNLHRLPTTPPVGD